MIPTISLRQYKLACPTFKIDMTVTRSNPYIVSSNPTHSNSLLQTITRSLTRHAQGYIQKNKNIDIEISSSIQKRLNPSPPPLKILEISPSVLAPLRCSCSNVSPIDGKRHAKCRLPPKTQNFSIPSHLSPFSSPILSTPINVHCIPVPYRTIPIHSISVPIDYSTLTLPTSPSSK